MTRVVLYHHTESVSCSVSISNLPVPECFLNHGRTSGHQLPPAHGPVDTLEGIQYLDYVNRFYTEGTILTHDWCRIDGALDKQALGYCVYEFYTFLLDLRDRSTHHLVTILENHGCIDHAYHDTKNYYGRLRTVLVEGMTSPEEAALHVCHRLGLSMYEMKQQLECGAQEEYGYRSLHVHDLLGHHLINQDAGWKR